MATQQNENRKTILSSADFNEPNTNISPLEKKLLDTAGEDDEERELHKAEVDNTDEDDELLNEYSSNDGGSQLDIPGSEEDDADEAIGEEDEENNGYSEADN